jgi:hypothetical protein
MTYRKTKLIQERNIRLEQKYIFEQVVTTTTTQKEMGKTDFDSLPFCSGFKNPPDSQEFETKFGRVRKKSNGVIYCRNEN